MSRVVTPRGGGATRRLTARLGALLAGALTLGMAATAQAAAPAFSGPTTVTVGTTPSAIAAGEFNGDGRRDLVVANLGSNTASILLGNGTGGATVGSSPATARQPQAIAVGDLNGNGTADLAVANNQDNNVSILLGNTNGTFSAASPASVAVGTKPTGVAIANLNGDTFPDLAVTNAPPGANTNGSVSILTGNGNGTFTAGTPVTVAQQPSAVVARDLNGDGKVDLVVANQGGNSISVALGNGNGTFGTPSSIAVGSGPSALAAGDLNGDGKLDLVVANGGANTVSILLGNGSGRFSAASGSPVTVGTNPRAVALGDLNGDGLTDLAVANGAGDSITVLPGNGNGTFGAAVTLANGSGTTPAGIVITDLDNDGRPDLAVADSGNAKAGIYLNTTTFPPTTISLSVGAASLGFGNLDIGATSSPLTASVGVTTNDTAGYTLSVTRSLFTGGDIPLSLTPLGVTTGASFDISTASSIPTSGSLGIGRRLGATSGAGDTWQFGLALGPVPFVQDGPHSSTLTFTALGL